jgi:hypothetical protein
MPKNFLPLSGIYEPVTAGFQARAAAPEKNRLHNVTFHSTTFDCGEMKRDKSERPA